MIVFMPRVFSRAAAVPATVNGDSMAQPGESP